METLPCLLEIGGVYPNLLLRWCIAVFSPAGSIYFVGSRRNIRGCDYNGNNRR